MSDLAETPRRIHLLIISPEETIYEGDVRWLQVPLDDGLIGIWPGHAPLMALVADGIFEFDTGQGIETIPSGGGILNVDPERCTIMTPGAAPEAASVGIPGQAGSGADVGALIDRLEEVLQELLPDEEIDDQQENTDG
jgi:hypothetical protein